MQIPVTVVQGQPDERRQIELAGRGLIAETADEKCCDILIAPASGTLTLALVGLLSGETVTNIIVHVSANGASITLAKVGLYDTVGNLLGSSADVDTSFSSGAVPRKVIVPLTTPYSVVSHGVYFAGFLNVNSSASPTILRGTTRTSVAVGAFPLPSGAQAGLSDLPNPATIVAGTHVPWLGIS